jgi:hypothetical protein
MTWDRRLYFPSEGRRSGDFFALKNPTASAGFEPANLGTRGQHASSRLPKQLSLDVSFLIISNDGGLKTLRFYGAMKVCPVVTFLCENFCRFATGWTKQHLTYILLGKDCFGPALPDCWGSYCLAATVCYNIRP